MLPALLEFNWQCRRFAARVVVEIGLNVAFIGEMVIKLGDWLVDNRIEEID